MKFLGHRLWFCLYFLTQDWVHGTRFNTLSHNLMVWGISLTKFKVCIYWGCIWRWWIGGWCFVKKSASLLVPLSQYNISCSSTYFFLNQCHFISHVFECFGFMTKFTKPSVVELSVLRGVTGCLWFNTIQSGCILIEVFLLLKLPHVSVYATKDITLRIFLHSVWIRQFLLGLGFIGLGDG